MLLVVLFSPSYIYIYMCIDYSSFTKIFRAHRAQQEWWTLTVGASLNSSLSSVHMFVEMSNLIHLNRIQAVGYIYVLDVTLTKFFVIFIILFYIHATLQNSPFSRVWEFFFFSSLNLTGWFKSLLESSSTHANASGHLEKEKKNVESRDRKYLWNISKMK